MFQNNPKKATIMLVIIRDHMTSHIFFLSKTDENNGTKGSLTKNCCKKCLWKVTSKKEQDIHNAYVHDTQLCQHLLCPVFVFQVLNILRILQLLLLKYLQRKHEMKWLNGEI